MAAEKQFENRVKRYLETLGIYPLGCAHDKMTVPRLVIMKNGGVVDIPKQGCRICTLW